MNPFLIIGLGALAFVIVVLITLQWHTLNAFRKELFTDEAMAADDAWRSGVTGIGTYDFHAGTPVHLSGPSKSSAQIVNFAAARERRTLIEPTGYAFTFRKGAE